ncbi:hypothetical protein glysoja_004184 [Glycine soja]|nr:hypothetical protein glysoja_004184 [Glycine soja]
MAAITATTRRTKTPPSPKAFKHEASFRHRWPRSMKLLPETPRTARRSSKPSALSATPSTKVPTTNKVRELLCIDVEGNIMLVEATWVTASQNYMQTYTIEECGRKIGLMAQILLHGTLHATVYEVDKLKIGGGNFLTKNFLNGGNCRVSWNLEG